ncbi:hypothetical protein OPT61_g4155 [Boeremia exigua]|uniref:Uncharacterized protein n=1 Tax=Boeremia exigua TaxID=749465 RepID=A0ACC2IFD2_9PLEO|nr:hypothetical protein OPT61_g4155 [Boeremia exigua]
MHMPLSDVTRLTARRGLGSDGLDSLGWCSRASVNVQGTDNPMNPAQLFSHDDAYWHVLFAVQRALRIEYDIDGELNSGVRAINNA